MSNSKTRMACLLLPRSIQQQMKTQAKRLSGFTLTEIMIVIAVIGVLTAIAIPSFMRARRNAQKNACISNMKKIEAAVDQWAVEESKARDSAVSTSDIFGTYLKTPVTCPAGSAPYRLTTASESPFCPNEATEPDHVLP